MSTAVELGPSDATLTVHTRREGLAARAGHDLLLEVTDWSATVTLAPDRRPTSVALSVDPRSLVVRRAMGGVKPLTSTDREQIHERIERHVLGTVPIAFRSTAVDGDRTHLVVHGDLSIAGETRSISATLDIAPDGRVTGTIPLTQSDWGIKPYRGLMGALRVQDTVEVGVDVRLQAR